MEKPQPPFLKSARIGRITLCICVSQAFGIGFRLVGLLMRRASTRGSAWRRISIALRYAARYSLGSGLSHPHNPRARPDPPPFRSGLLRIADANAHKRARQCESIVIETFLQSLSLSQLSAHYCHFSVIQNAVITNKRKPGLLEAKKNSYISSKLKTFCSAVLLFLEERNGDAVSKTSKEKIDMNTK